MCRCTSWARTSTRSRRSSCGRVLEQVGTGVHGGGRIVPPVPGVMWSYFFILSAMVTIQPSGASKANSRMP